MSDLSSTGMAVAFFAGIASFLSPCVLPLVPGYVSYIAGQSLQHASVRRRSLNRLASVGMAAMFSLGFSTVFVALGAGATTLGHWLLKYRYEANIVAGLVVTLFGLFMLGFLRRASWLQRDWRFHPRFRGGHPVTAYILGLAFGFGWSPCIGPVLGTILTLSAMSAQPAQGTSLLAIYAAGLAIPFLISALFTDSLIRHLKPMRRFGRSLHAVAAILMVVMGLAIMTDQLTVFSVWLLRAFPALGTIG